MAIGAILRPSFATAGRGECLLQSIHRRSCKEGTLEESRSLILDLLMISWGVITIFLVVLVIYRGTLSSKEDDQIFIDAAEQHHYQEQQAIIARISRLTKPIIALAVVSGALLLASAGVWIYRGLRSF
jgi:hypothetical protein